MPIGVSEKSVPIADKGELKHFARFEIITDGSFHSTTVFVYLSNIDWQISIPLENIPCDWTTLRYFAMLYVFNIIP